MRQFKDTFGLLIDKRIQSATKKNRFFDLTTIQKMKRPQILVFFLYLIPGIPNGILPYLFAETTIPLSTYLISMSVASIPSTLLLTWLGDSVLKRNHRVILLIIAATLLILGISLCFRKQIKAKIQSLT